MNSLLNGVGMTSARTRERLVQRLERNGVSQPAVLEAIRQTPRHIFVDEALASRAYEDTALPIGHGQTISQPWVVARMTEILLNAIGHGGKVLEVGTGSGYQTAILARLFQKIYTVERINALLMQARSRLRSLEIHNVRYKHSDGAWGWEHHAPYDGIIVTAAPAQLPQSLLEQLSMDGCLIAPVGGGRNQVLTVVRRGEQGYTQEAAEPVVFVPLLGGVT